MMTMTMTEGRRVVPGHTQAIFPESEHAEFLAGEALLDLLAGLVPTLTGSRGLTGPARAEHAKRLGHLAIRCRRATGTLADAQAPVAAAMRSLYREGRLKRMPVARLANLIIDKLGGERVLPAMPTRDQAMIDVERQIRRDVDRIAGASGHERGEPLRFDKVVRVVGPSVLTTTVRAGGKRAGAAQMAYEFPGAHAVGSRWAQRQARLAGERVYLLRKHWGPFIFAWAARQPREAVAA